MAQLIQKQKISQWSWADHWDRSVEEAVSELEREAHVRQRCFDRWVEDGRVSFIDARDRQERLLSAIRLLRSLEDCQLLLAQSQGEVARLVTEAAAQTAAYQAIIEGVNQEDVEPQPGAAPVLTPQFAPEDEPNQLESGETPY